MPGGNTRHSIAFSPYPIYVRSGEGCRVTDVEGEERVDFINNATVAILGHRNPEVMEAVARQLELGTSFAMPTEPEVELASLLVERVDYIDKVRFCNSGTEAVMNAIKAARVFTGKPKIAKFEGAYHGTYDYAQVSLSPATESWGNAASPLSVQTLGSTPQVAEDVVVLPWNNIDACVELIEANREQLAALLFDPLPASLGLIPPKPGFIEKLRDVTCANGVLMLADEVVSFRLSYRGGCAEFGIAPDLVALAKIIGGGFPVGAVAGSDEVMDVFDHTRESGEWLMHGGTFNANPVTMTAGLATMKQLTPQVFERLDRMGDELRGRIQDVIDRREFPAQVTGKGSLFWIHLTGREMNDYRTFVSSHHDWSGSDYFAHHMLDRGIVCINRDFGCLSTPMGERELGIYVEALEESLDAIRSGARAGLDQ